MSNYCFLRGDVMAMERTILASMDYNISLPTRLYFLNRFMLAAHVEDCSVPSRSLTTSFEVGVVSDDGGGGSATNTSPPTTTLDLHQYHATTERNYREACFAYYLLDLTLLNYAFNQYPMSVVAAAIVHYVKQSFRPLNELVWTPTLVFYTGFEEYHLVPVVHAIQVMHTAAFSCGFMAIPRKYHCHQYRHCSNELALSSQRVRFDTIAARRVRDLRTTALRDLKTNCSEDGNDGDDDEASRRRGEQGDGDGNAAGSGGGGATESARARDRLNVTPISFIDLQDDREEDIEQNHIVDAILGDIRDETYHEDDNEAAVVSFGVIAGFVSASGSGSSDEAEADAKAETDAWTGAVGQGYGFKLKFCATEDSESPCGKKQKNK